MDINNKQKQSSLQSYSDPSFSVTAVPLPPMHPSQAYLQVPRPARSKNTSHVSPPTQLTSNETLTVTARQSTHWGQWWWWGRCRWRSSSTSSCPGPGSRRSWPRTPSTAGCRPAGHSRRCPGWRRSRSRSRRTPGCPAAPPRPPTAWPRTMSCSYGARFLLPLLKMGFNFSVRLVRL